MKKISVETEAHMFDAMNGYGIIFGDSDHERFKHLLPMSLEHTGHRDSEAGEAYSVDYWSIEIPDDQVAEWINAVENHGHGVSRITVQ